MQILLTGAGGGIGSAIKAALEEAGGQVIAIDRQDADLASYAEIAALCKQVAKDGPLDWLVFAHGFISAETEFEKQTAEEIRMTFELNTLSVIHLTQLLLPKLSPSGGIIFISSTSGINPNGRYATYSASKAAVNAFAKALARNKPEHTFYSVCPGPTDTAMRVKIGGDAKAAQSPAVVASLIAKLVSDAGAYKSGDVIVVRDGEISGTQ